MIKSKDDMSTEITIDLTGPDGNAFSLLANAKSLGKQLGMEEEEIKAIHSDMMSGDYDRLVEVFDENFGSFVTLYR